MTIVVPRNIASDEASSHHGHFSTLQSDIKTPTVNHLIFKCPALPIFNVLIISDKLDCVNILDQLLA